MNSFIKFIFSSFIALIVINILTDGIFYFPETFLPWVNSVNSFVEYIVVYKYFYIIILISLFILIACTFFFKKHRVMYIVWFILTYLSITSFKLWFIFEKIELTTISFNLWQIFPIILHAIYFYVSINTNSYKFKSGVLFHASIPLIWAFSYLLGVLFYRVFLLLW